MGDCYWASMHNSTWSSPLPSLLSLKHLYLNWSDFERTTDPVNANASSSSVVLANWWWLVISMGALAVFHLTNVLHYNHQIFQLQLYHELYCQGRELWSGKKTYICRHLRVLSLHEKKTNIRIWYVQRKCRGLIRYNTNNYAIFALSLMKSHSYHLGTNFLASASQHPSPLP